MKTIIFVVAGLAVGTVGGTAFGGLKGKSVILAEMAAEEAAQAASQDPLEAPGSDDHEGQAGEEPSVVPPDPATAHVEAQGSQEVLEDPAAQLPGAHGDVAEEQGSAPLESPGEEAEAVPVPAGPVPEGAEQAPPEGGQGTQRLAKIFGAMKAPDAAKVLQNLDDEEVSAILFHLTDRKAAEILGNFEPERAATLSRAVLGSPGGEGS